MKSFYTIYFHSSKKIVKNLGLVEMSVGRDDRFIFPNKKEAKKFIKLTNQ